MIPAPSLSVMADLYRACFHFVSHGEQSIVRPALGGVRIERALAGGIVLIASGEAGMIVLRDAAGFIERDATIKIVASHVHAARRNQREANVGRDETTRLSVELGVFKLTPGAGDSYPALEIDDSDFPAWRKLIPPRAAAKRVHPPIAPDAIETLSAATAILSRLDPQGFKDGVQIASSEDGLTAIAPLGNCGFAFLKAVEDVAPRLPWAAPTWLVGEHAPQEARA